MKTPEEKAWEYTENDLGDICFMETGLDKESAYNAVYDAFLAGNRSATEWIPITPETMPEDGVDVILHSVGIGSYQGYILTNGGAFSSLCHGPEMKDEFYPTHWLPLPEKP